MSDDDPMVLFARELVGDVAAARLLDVLLTAGDEDSPHTSAGRTLAGARWGKVPAEVEGRPVQGVLRHPQSSTALLDLGGGHFAEHSGGKAGPVMHSDQFSPQAMAVTGWQVEHPRASEGTESGTPAGKESAKPVGEGSDSADKSKDRLLVSKASVHYRTAEDPAQTCHTCKFVYGDEPDGKCRIVMGTVRPTDVCDRWSKGSVSGAEDHPAGDGEGGARRERPAQASPRAAAALALQDTGDKLAHALASGRATDESETLDGHGQAWKADRASAHNEIVGDMLARAVPVPAERRAVLLAGLGSGKPAALARAGAYDVQRHAVVSTDDIKAEMGKRKMIPEVEGLTPAQSGVLAHHEASHVANLAIAALAARGKNMVIDGSMVTGRPQDRVADLRSKGYSDVRAIHLDTPVEKAVHSARSEGRKGKYVPAETIRSAAGSHGSDATREAFDTLAPSLDGWERWSGSGAEPVRTAKGGKPPVASVRAVEDLLREEPGGSGQQ
jgi:hypothetical protein